jgi:chemotaxis protein MotB
MPDSNKWFGSDEANYLISVSDIMMGLLYVFIIMIVSYAFMVQQTEKKMVTAIEDAEMAEEDSLRSKQRADRLEKETLVALKRLSDSRTTRTALLKDIQNDLKNQNIRIIIDENSGIVRLPEGVVTFKHGESEFQDENSENNLFKVSEALNNIIPCYLPDYQSHECKGQPSHYMEAVFIEGHTDTTGAEDINWQLSTQRALKAFWFITSAQPNLKEYTNELGQPLLSVSGYGKLRPQPRDPEMDEKTYHSINRRIDFRFIMTPPENYQVDRNKSGWTIERKDSN